MKHRTWDDLDGHRLHRHEHETVTGRPLNRHPRTSPQCCVDFDLVDSNPTLETGTPRVNSVSRPISLSCFHLAAKIQCFRSLRVCRQANTGAQHTSYKLIRHRQINRRYSFHSTAILDPGSSHSTEVGESLSSTQLACRIPV